MNVNMTDTRWAMTAMTFSLMGLVSIIAYFSHPYFVLVSVFDTNIGLYELAQIFIWGMVIVWVMDKNVRAILWAQRKLFLLVVIITLSIVSFALKSVEWIIQFRHRQEIERVQTSLATPLMQAALHCNIPKMRILLGSGTDVHEVNKLGFTAIDYASGAIPPYFDQSHKCAEAVMLLLAHDADVDTSGHAGITPLIEASAEGHIKIMEILLSHGADVNKTSTAGWSALANAVYYQHEEAVSLLLKHGANPNPTIKGDSKTILNVARQKGNPRILAGIEQAIAKNN